jgi:hypothetical protein
MACNSIVKFICCDETIAACQDSAHNDPISLYGTYAPTGWRKSLHAARTIPGHQQMTKELTKGLQQTNMQHLQSRLLLYRFQKFEAV